MSTINLRKIHQGLVLLIALSFTGSAMAVKKIIYMESAIEANSIHVFTSKEPGTIQANDCEKCPVTLTINDKTQFFYQNKPATKQQINLLSGKGGTVLYDQDSGIVNRVLWW